MSYTPTNWQTGDTITAEKLNKIESALQSQDSAIDDKVDKVTGKALSTNDYTDEEKSKLNGIETGANKTIVDSSLSDSSTNPVQNKIVKGALDNKTNNSDFTNAVDNVTFLAKTNEIVEAIHETSDDYDFSDWKDIVRALRRGDGGSVPNGQVFTVPHEVYGDIDFVVRRKNVEKVIDDITRPTITIQSKYLLSLNAGTSASSFQYDRQEAFAKVSEAIAANTICKFTTIGYGGWTAGTYNFTATSPIAANSMLCISGYQNTALTSLKVQVFDSPKDSTPSAQYDIASGEGGATVDLGTWGTNANHPQRVSYGSNNDAESNIMQFLNGDSGDGYMSSIWEQKTKYDMMCASFSSLKGFLGGFSDDFQSSLGLCAVHNLTNDVYESDDSSYTKSTEYTYPAYFWLPSRKEVYGTNENSRENSETQFPYYQYLATQNADKLMYAKGASSPTTYWLRTPYASYAYYVRICYTGSGGALNGSYALNSCGVAPLAILT